MELVYATKVPSIGALGSVSARLPRPDLLVTESRWDWYLPGRTRLPATLDQHERGSRGEPDYRGCAGAGDEGRDRCLVRERGQAFPDPRARVGGPFRVRDALREPREISRLASACRTLRGQGSRWATWRAFSEFGSLYVAFRFDLGNGRGSARSLSVRRSSSVPVAFYGVSLLPALVLAATLAVRHLRHEIRARPRAARGRRNRTGRIMFWLSNRSISCPGAPSLANTKSSRVSGEAGKARSTGSAKRGPASSARRSSFSPIATFATRRRSSTPGSSTSSATALSSSITTPKRRSS